MCPHYAPIDRPLCFPFVRSAFLDVIAIVQLMSVLHSWMSTHLFAVQLEFVLSVTMCDCFFFLHYIILYYIVLAYRVWRLSSSVVSPFICFGGMALLCCRTQVDLMLMLLLFWLLLHISSISWAWYIPKDCQALICLTRFFCIGFFLYAFRYACKILERSRSLISHSHSVIQTCDLWPNSLCCSSKSCICKKKITYRTDVAQKQFHI